MPALVADIHAFFRSDVKEVDGGDKPGHDGRWSSGEQQKGPERSEP